MNPFEGDYCLKSDYLKIINQFNPTLLIETGTHLGNTTEFIATLNIPFMAVEKDGNFFNITNEKIKHHKHVNLIQGDSAETLEAQFEYLKDKKILAFLDAHWGGGFILERELELMAKLPIKPFLILHDFYNPEHPEYGYDSHDGHPYTYEFYRPYIEKIYGQNYKHCFNSECDRKSTQGVLFINPK